MRAPLLLSLLVLSSGSAAAQPCTEASLERGGARPELSGPEQTLSSADGRFLLHWTNEGSDAPASLGDQDGDGTPDFAARVLTGLLEGDTAFAEAGYRRAAPDDGDGGSDAIDVYMRAIDANGYAFHAPAEDGSDAPSSCTIHLESSLGDSLPAVLESVAAHELHHCVQYAYTTDGPSWMLESTATFEQYRLFSSPALLAAVEVLWRTRLSQPERPLPDLGGRFEYAGFIFPWFWERSRDGGRARVPELWEALGAADGDWAAALEQASIDVFDQPFAATFLEFATWNAFACARDDGQHYPPEPFPCALPDSMVPAPEVGSEVSFSLPGAPYSAAYATHLTGDDLRPLRARCALTEGEGTRVRLRLVALGAFGQEQEAAEAVGRDGESFAVALGQPQASGGSTLLVAVSTGSGPAEFSCTLDRIDPPPPADPPVQESPGSACDCSSASGGASLALLLFLLPKRARRRTEVRRRA